MNPRTLLRGVAWWGPDDRPLRADPADRGRLPGDTWERAGVPAGVRLEFVARGATAVELDYTAYERSPADRLRPDPPVFALLSDGALVTEAPARPGARTVRLPLPRPDGAYTVHLPEVLRPVLRDVRGAGAGPPGLAPAPPRPRWLVHGDSIVEGWSGTRPHRAWPAVAGRALGAEDVNLGYAGAARGELASAQQLAALDADLVTLAFGTNCWSRTPMSAPLLYETARAFLAVVRRGHPDVPLLVVSPVLRPDAESTPNALGATLAELRAAIERAALDAGGGVRLLRGGPLLGPGHLVDGVHPGDEGHARIAAAVVENLKGLVRLDNHIR
ncbi:GDSL-type esterase/lipase family protein [Streptomyces sp. VRA16 Mangrove soil]|uniref:GDSL-type esterase/lipase family protein n=1 Tax=Streptomyces sp. VRA16 Mangrove soil TaxID=2817434 RepID=UPI001A9FE939|nr:GDSL-type esterase/lipase family protein [Streptomyces sp. VRA16 Mangrove soil]MBO1330942.1 GDSL family lipase [Streptomyces sp. VRA16 Mangrove soil]